MEQPAPTGFFVVAGLVLVQQDSPCALVDVFRSKTISNIVEPATLRAQWGRFAHRVSVGVVLEKPIAAGLALTCNRMPRTVGRVEQRVAHNAFVCQASVRVLLLGVIARVSAWTRREMRTIVEDAERPVRSVNAAKAEFASWRVLWDMSSVRGLASIHSRAAITVGDAEKPVLLG